MILAHHSPREFMVKCGGQFSHTHVSDDQCDFNLLEKIINAITILAPKVAASFLIHVVVTRVARSNLGVVLMLAVDRGP